MTLLFKTFLDFSKSYLPPDRGVIDVSCYAVGIYVNMTELAKFHLLCQVSHGFVMGIVISKILIFITYLFFFFFYDRRKKEIESLYRKILERNRSSFFYI